MKKALAMALGAVLVAGSAAPASATNVDFSGFYGAHYAVNGNLGYTSDDNLNETFFEQRFQVNVNFQATDEVSVHWRFRAPIGQRWGDNNHANVQTRFVYGQVVQDWGTVRVGRLAGGLGDEFGLSSLGYAPALDNQFTYIAPFEGSAEYDGIQYANTWDNGFGLVATYQKIKDSRYKNWATTGGNGSAAGADVVHRSSDHDADRYQIQGAYQWDGGAAALNFVYLRDATGDGINHAPAGTPASWENATLVDQAEDKTNAWFINPAIMHSWGAFSFHFEGMIGFGETDLYDNDNTGPYSADAEGQGFYLDFDYNYGPGRVNLAGWWVSGTDLDDEDSNNLVDLVGGNFYPLVVAYGPANAYYGDAANDSRRGTNGAVGVANNGTSFVRDNLGTAFTTVTSISAGTTNVVAGAAMPADFGLRNNNFNTNGNTNHWALMISGQHAFTDEITFNYALAYLALNNPNYRVATRGTTTTVRTAWDANSIRYATQDKDLGFEIDLGVNVQLLDNLALTSTVGYMFTGDAYKQLKGYRATDAAGGEYSVNAIWEDADDAYSWLTSLTFSF